MISHTEEDYLKALFRLVSGKQGKQEAGTNALADLLSLKPASVNNMLKKLRKKELIDYEKYGKISFTDKGRQIALLVVRKHRLWETFLVDKLGFSWDRVHDIAEQLEHIRSDELVEKLDWFLGHPEYDPHGDPIPRSDGSTPTTPSAVLSSMQKGDVCKVMMVKDTSAAFLQYLERLSIHVGTCVSVMDKVSFDNSLVIEVDGKHHTVSQKVADNLYVSYC
ncbi:MAG: metal-dependent transcriptional regulator [Cytophagales bacterium]|nr:metal-dependent transcriptional regulator [Cytophagales bacterium]